MSLSRTQRAKNGKIGPIEYGAVLVSGRNTKGWHVSCADCHTKACNTALGSRTDEGIVRSWFLERGWKIYNRHAMCARCVAPKPVVEVKKSPVRKETNVTNISSPKPEVVPEGVRAIDKKTERRLYALLESYLDEVPGGWRYRDDWTDEKVAQDAGCQLWWVRRTREDAYGKLAAPPEVLDVRTDIEKLRSEIGQLLNAVAAAEANLSAVDKRVAKIEAKHG